ncbi:MAG: hypothetical protein JSV23_04715 [Promethearchaeota archaeon]|nr:MAG: hypothetical protein JSV23_04715 [Candidatus Lokiarchaeota archaeon]
MEKENILPQRSTSLRKTGSKELKISINGERLQDIFLINGTCFITEGISNSDLKIKPNSYYMIINNGKNKLKIYYSQDISNYKIIYDPYKYESSIKIKFKPELFKKRYHIPKGYIDTLPKWYSFKFTYPDYNLIFVRPEFGLSIQIHKYRNEYWEIVEGEPIIINGKKVYYFVQTGMTFKNPINTYHSIINPNQEKNKFVMIRERWNGIFDENDIKRLFNPNKYI